MNKINNDDRSEKNYRFWDYHYVKPGQQKEYEAVAAEWMKLAAKKKVEQSWIGHEGRIGTDQPVYVYVASAKNAAEFYQQNDKLWNAMGTEGGQLFQKFHKYLRKRDVKTGRFRKGLSYNPE